MIKAHVIAKSIPVTEDILGADDLIAYCSRAAITKATRETE